MSGRIREERDQSKAIKFPGNSKGSPEINDKKLKYYVPAQVYFLSATFNSSGTGRRRWKF